MSLPAAFLSAIEQQIPSERCFSDPLSMLTMGTDASFYRLLPKLVVRVESEAEVAFILQQASAQQVAVTFRAAGTSLSGQAISDSVLIVRSEEHTSELQSRPHLVCRLLLEKKKNNTKQIHLPSSHHNFR